VLDFLTQRAVELVAELPDSADEVPARRRAAIAELLAEIVDTWHDCVIELHRAGDDRGAWRRECRRLLDAQHAGDVVEAWAGRAGLAELPPRPGVRVVEEPDGELVLRRA